MKLKSQAFKMALMMFASAEVSAADCQVGSSPRIVDGLKKCVLNYDIIVVIDPEWIVAGGVVIALMLAATIYLAIQVGRLANKLKDRALLR